MGEEIRTTRELDAGYKPFPAFRDWAALIVLENQRWDRYLERLQEETATRSTPHSVLLRARGIAKRAAALDTGAIESLYEVDTSFTYTVAFETGAWEAALTQKGEQVRPLFESQLRAYDYVLDLATRAEPLGEAAIRTLHTVICSSQPTYRVMTAVGPQERPLPRGVYKDLPNHVRTRRGDDHSYAPVDATGSEMQRLMNELRSTEFLGAHPVLQAAYSHYCFVVVHPFADGNGRVARALASVYTYRSISMPIVVFAEHKTPYIDALELADSGLHQSFVTFMLARALETISLVTESLLAAAAPSPRASLEAVEELYVTKGGYSHEQVDEAGSILLSVFEEELKRAAEGLRSERVSISISSQEGHFGTKEPNVRAPLTRSRFIHVRCSLTHPLSGLAGRQYSCLLPMNAGGEDDVQLRTAEGKSILVARIDEIVPKLSGSLRIRVGLFAERVLAEVLSQLRELAHSKPRI